MTETAQPNTIAQRIAALKLAEVGRHSGERPAYTSNGSNVSKKAPPPPPPPPRARQIERSNSASFPVSGSQVSSYDGKIGNLPEAPSETIEVAVNASRAPDGHRPPTQHLGTTQTRPTLPPRKSTNDPECNTARSPANPTLPPRRPSAQTNGRRDSASSSVSARSSTSVASSAIKPVNAQFTIKAPSYDPSTLPKSPARRDNDEPTRTSLPRTTSSSSLSRTEPASPGIIQARPPVLPSRTSQQSAALPARPKRSALSMGFGDSSARGTTNKPIRPDSAPVPEVTPPPIPTSSRPDLSKLLASKPKIGTVSQTATSPQNRSTPSSSQGSCLRCRDFSAVDAHAARFPRQSIPSTDVGWLAHNLTSPFPSLTDKARVIFTWLHYNIDYNVRDFFSGNIKPSTPASTIASGLAVCEGYAGVFAALATKAGLEAVVVGGHGKGFGFNDIVPGGPLPPFKAGHAWNAVRIDGGEWKLIDPCWGAGHVTAEQTYERKFNPLQFTLSNEEFGERHFPENDNYFFRADGRRPSWEEYLLCDTDRPHIWRGIVDEEGLTAASFAPKGKKLSLSGERHKPYSRFVFERVCPHWDNERNGKGKDYCYLLYLQDGKKRVPFKTNGLVWWVDVKPTDLGSTGEMVRIMAVTQFQGNDGRGVMPEDYVERCNQAWTYVADWELVA